MITTVTQKNMVTIPAKLGRKFGIKPGFQLEWEIAGQNQITVHILPSRDILACQLLGKGKMYAEGRNLANEVDAEREREG